MKNECLNVYRLKRVYIDTRVLFIKRRKQDLFWNVVLAPSLSRISHLSKHTYGRNMVANFVNIPKLLKKLIPHSTKWLDHSLSIKKCSEQ